MKKTTPMMDIDIYKHSDKKRGKIKIDIK